MTANYAHLSPAARVQAALGADDRIRAIHGARWIPHPRAQHALDRLDFLFGYPKCARMQCLLIYGDSGIGKTMVLEKFLRDHPPAFDREAGIEHVPVLAIQMPAAPDEKRFYAQLLAGVGAPSAADERLHRIEARALRLLKALRLQLIVIDEVHHLLAGNAREQRRALNLLKFLANELRVSLVVIGTTDALTAMQTDLQVASRFEPLHLPRWTASEELRGFLAAYVRGLPLREPSEITDQASVSLLLARSAGITGRITLTVARAAEMAIRKGDERISLAWLEARPAACWTWRHVRRERGAAAANRSAAAADRGAGLLARARGGRLRGRRAWAA